MTGSVILSLKQTPEVPVEAESLLPANVAGKDLTEIGRLPLLVGKKWETVADWFEVSFAAAQGTNAETVDAPADLMIQGDLTRFKRLGEGMASGTMRVIGPVGFHAGARMTGGQLTIVGDAADFLGSHMSGGTIIVRGNVGHYTAAAYRGFSRGMKGGTIIISGSAGQMLGARMRRGLIYVRGDSGDVTGYNMKAGTIVVGGTPGVRVGARMVRGTVMLLGQSTPLLPTFSYDCTYQPVFWAMLHRQLTDWGFAPPADATSSFQHFSGDVNEGGQGEVLVRA